MPTKKTSEWEKEINNFIGWNSKFGLHISDGTDSCSGTDEEEEQKAKEYLIKLFRQSHLDLIKRINREIERIKYHYKHPHDFQIERDNLYYCQACRMKITEVISKNSEGCPHFRSYNKALSDLRQTLAKIKEEYEV